MSAPETVSNLMDAETLHREFPALKDIVYVDHAATTFVSRTQLDRYREDILHNIYGNPHSRSPSSQLATDTIDQVRYRILKFFNTSLQDYTVIFTAGCTASLKLLGESFDYHGEIDGQNIKSQTNSNENTINTSKDSSQKGEKSNCFNNQNDLRTDSIRSEPTSDSCLTEDLSSKTRLSHIEGAKATTIVNNELTESFSTNQTEQCGNHGNVTLPSGCQGSFTYLLDNHTSVQGMRELALQKAGKVQCIDCDHDFNFVTSSISVLKQHPSYTGCGNHLFVYPAQSNFNGTKYPLHWISKVKDMCYQWQQESHAAQLDKMKEQKVRQDVSLWFVCLDAASLVSTSDLDLGKVKPDFVTLSFYKMFGFPTGLGALIVKNTAAHVLNKTYFGGGTVSVSLPLKPFHRSRSSLAERFEDGTLPFLDIIALKYGFDVLSSLAGGITKISHHTFDLAQYFYNQLTWCCHGNRSPVAVVYCTGDYTNIETQGGIVNFNLLRPSGDYIGFAEVDKLAQLFNIHLRTGCFCNIGACQKYLNITDEQIKNNFESGHVCGDNKDLIDGQPTGSIRISFGYMSTMEDVQKCLQFIVDCFMENTQKPVFWRPSTENQTKQQQSVDDKMSSVTIISDESLTANKTLSGNQTKEGENNNDKMSSSTISSDDPLTLKSTFNLDTKSKNMTMEDSLSQHQNISDNAEFFVCRHKQLREICLYPVKSCGAFKVKEWQLGQRGLMFDREWMIVTETGIAMSQKREKNLCLIRPTIDLERDILTLNYPGMKPVAVSMSSNMNGDISTKMCNSKVCGDRVESTDCGQEVADWLSDALQRPGCRLLRQKQDDGRVSKLTVKGDAESEKSQLSLANEGQYLLISQESVMELQRKIVQQFDEEFKLANLEDRFRANLVVSGCEPFEEDGWTEVQIGVVTFKSQGVCTRCQMVCLDQHTGDRNKSPLQVLSTWTNRKTSFGVLLCSDITRETSVKMRTIRVGDPVFV